MSDLKHTLENTINELKTQRDELELQLHLGAADAKDEYQKAKSKFDEMLNQYAPVKDAVDESAENVWESLTLVGDEIKQSFQRISKSLK